MNTNYEKDFVPYEQALALKELGFDEPFKIFDQAIVWFMFLDRKNVYSR